MPREQNHTLELYVLRVVLLYKMLRSASKLRSAIVPIILSSKSITTSSSSIPTFLTALTARFTMNQNIKLKQFQYLRNTFATTPACDVTICLHTPVISARSLYSYVFVPKFNHFSQRSKRRKLRHTSMFFCEEICFSLPGYACCAQNNFIWRFWRIRVVHYCSAHTNNCCAGFSVNSFRIYFAFLIKLSW